VKSSIGTKRAVIIVALAWLLLFSYKIHLRIQTNIDHIRTLCDNVEANGYLYSASDESVGYFTAESSDNIAYTIDVEYHTFTKGHYSYNDMEVGREVTPGTNASFSGYKPNWDVLDIVGDYTSKLKWISDDTTKTYTIYSGTPCTFMNYNKSDSEKVHYLYIGYTPDDVYNKELARARDQYIFMGICWLIILIVAIRKVFGISHKTTEIEIETGVDK
jgi:hypothetical protein